MKLTQNSNVLITASCERFMCPTFFSGSHALFIRPASIFFHKNNFKTGSHGTSHTFKNYFVTVFSVFNNKWYPNGP